MFRYYSEKPCNHAGYRAFLLRQNGDLTIILAYMYGDLRYTCGGKVDLCMDKPVFKRKIYDEIYEWK